MKGFFAVTSVISLVGLLVSIVLCFLFPPLGIVLLIINLVSLSSSSKGAKKAQDAAEKKEKIVQSNSIKENADIELSLKLSEELSKRNIVLENLKCNSIYTDEFRRAAREAIEKYDGEKLFKKSGY